MDYGRLILVFAVLWIVQVILTLRQRKHMQQVLSEVKNSHKEGFLGVGIARSRFNFGPGLVLILVVDNQEIIKSAHVLRGISIFAKFKQETDYDGLNVGAIEFDKRNRAMKKAFETAIDQIEMVKTQSND